MMEQSDLVRLKKIRPLIRSSIKQGALLGELADHVLERRDDLKFVDDVWHHSLTQHLVTLDSASTFEAANAVEQHQVDKTVAAAVDAILQLIEMKLNYGDGCNNS